VTQDADARLRVTSVGPRRARGVLRHAGRDLTLDIPQARASTTSRTPPPPRWWRSRSGSTPTPWWACSRAFPGVARRFELVGTTAGDIHVVDDYAHNGEKIRAAINDRAGGSARVGRRLPAARFGPARLSAWRAQGR